MTINPASLPAISLKLEDKIKAEAQHLGFELSGITTPEPPPHFSVFSDWVSAGRHGEMAYLATDRSLQRRADPRLILPDCQSILVLGIRYHSPNHAPQPTHAGQGRVAAYAWGDDYHDVLPPRLQALVQFIENEVGHPVPNRWYTDTGPILERDLAQRAGLGWVGKNTCLINPQHGSYFLLAEILLALPLTPDLPIVTDHCGTCRRCIDACPTSCILEDRTLDARRCISYLTIELKGDIPDSLQPSLAPWVFGCDICQEVCPWNQRFSRPAGDPAFAPRQGIQTPDLAAESQLSEEEFRLKFKGSPLKRAKFKGYLRNIQLVQKWNGLPKSPPAARRP